MVIPICRCSFQSTPVLKRTNLLDTRRLQARRENDSDRWERDPRLIRFKIARTIRLSKKDDNAKASKSSTRLMERGRRSGKRRRRGLRDNKDIHNYNGIIPGGCNAKQTYFAATCTLERSATLSLSPYAPRLPSGTDGITVNEIRDRSLRHNLKHLIPRSRTELRGTKGWPDVVPRGKHPLRGRYSYA